MIPRIDEIVWRGAWLLIVFQDKDDLNSFCQNTDCYIRVYWDDKCLAEGYAYSMIDKETVQGRQLMLEFVDMLENSGGQFEWPTTVEISCKNEKRSYPIERARRKEKEWGTWETWEEHLPIPFV
ncbi:MAG: hypothetical protein NTX82_00720 [Candidatus Parcubacteria bacterium]|nr:hypothetical protein [Candidatus Parcubacteria bacterium]